MDQEHSGERLSSLEIEELFEILQLRVQKNYKSKVLNQQDTYKIVEALNAILNGFDHKIYCVISQKTTYNLMKSVEALKEEYAQRYWFVDVNHNENYICLTVTSAASEEIKALINDGYQGFAVSVKEKQ